MDLEIDQCGSSSSSKVENGRLKKLVDSLSVGQRSGHVRVLTENEMAEPSDIGVLEQGLAC
jgi:hypothetical protein